MRPKHQQTSKLDGCCRGRSLCGVRSSPTASAPDLDPKLLVAAQGGDEDAFGRLVEPYRRELHAHCYRMLGSLHDAEDALQDAMLRAWRGLAGFGGPGLLRAWLYRIATNACLDAIARRPKRVLPAENAPAAGPGDGLGEPLVESVWVEPYPDELLEPGEPEAAPEARYEQREAVELAFIAAMQHLPPQQRAALILREVLGFSAKETAESLDSSTASVNSALQRARKTVEERLPEQSQQQTLRSLGDERLREIVEAYMDAMQRGDVPAVVGMLASDAAWSMPPLPAWFAGSDSITAFLEAGPLSGQWRWRHLPTRVNGQAAVATYTWWEERGEFLPFSVDVLTLEGDRIAEICSFIVRSTDARGAEHYRRFPAQPLDDARAEALFAGAGLPLSVG